MIKEIASYSSCITRLFVLESFLKDSRTTEIENLLRPNGTRTIVVEDGVLQRVGETKTPPPVAATVKCAGNGWDSLNGIAPTLLLVLDGLRDPGNLGTLVRSAAAFGADGIVVSGESVDIWNPKVVRSSAGLLWKIPIVASRDFKEVALKLREFGMSLVATIPNGGSQIDEVDLKSPIAVVIGSESAGIDEKALKECDFLATIPMRNSIESLNAATSATVALYEVVRQRGFANLK